jgi:hypothetical protein
MLAFIKEIVAQILVINPVFTVKSICVAVTICLVKTHIELTILLSLLSVLVNKLADSVSAVACHRKAYFLNPVRDL